MKLMQIFEEMSIESIRQYHIDSMRRAFNVPEDTVFISVFHGTSEKNAKNIVRTKLRKYSWLTTDESEARMYSQHQAHGGKPYVMSLRVYIGSCVPNGNYITTEEDLYPISNGMVPKDLKLKAHGFK